MVLEHIFPENWLEKKIRYAFLLAFVYSTVSLLVARVLFPSNTGIVSVALISLLLIPYIRKLIKKEELLEESEKSFSLKHLYKDNKTIIKVYLALFLGIYFTFVLYSFVFPMIGFDTGRLFDAQLALDKGTTGSATFSGLFFDIFLNNWWVLLVTFGLALIVEEGAFFFVAWNASAWGAILGYRAYAASLVSGSSIMNLLAIELITFPHLVIEGASYILAVVAGQVISVGVIKKSSEMNRFLGYLFLLMIGYVVAFIFVRAVIPNQEFFGILSMVLIFLILYLCGMAFTVRKHKEVFTYNYNLFVIAVILFVIGAIVETIVLSNSSLLNEIYTNAAFATLP